QPPPAARPGDLRDLLPRRAPGVEERRLPGALPLPRPASRGRRRERPPAEGGGALPRPPPPRSPRPRPRPRPRAGAGRGAAAAPPPGRAGAARRLRPVRLAGAGGAGARAVAAIGGVVEVVVRRPAGRPPLRGSRARAGLRRRLHGGGAPAGPPADGGLRAA